MVAPIVVLLVATPPADPSLVGVLVESCSRAAQPAVCVLGDPASPGDGGPRVLVSVYDGGARARAEIFAPAPAGPGEASSARDVAFRELDPAPDRFRALGLVVAGLAGATPADAGEERPPDRDAVALEAPPPPSGLAGGPVWSVAGVIGVAPVRPRAGAWAGVDVPWRGSPVFGRVGVSYEQTWRPDSLGIGEQREKVSLGVGLRFPVAAGGLTLRVPVEVELEHLAVSIVQPGTGREDSGDRVLFGVGTGAELAWLLGDRTSVFVAGRGSLLQGPTAVQVAGAPATTIPSWESSIALGLNVRIP